ncbi:YkvA family protein [Hirschia litorea]|uniref:YkvA family protein n=1 Tax=Hirschia litorea TaxID=1199156 RepID=A0ABW2IKP7_9PROT
MQIEILDPETEDEIAERKLNAEKARKALPKLLKFVRHIPFAEDVAASYYCAFDKETPGRVRGVLLAALAYFVVPTDVIPDFILALGFSDDATVIAMAMGIVSGHIKSEHRREAQLLLGTYKEKKS